MRKDKLRDMIRSILPSMARRYARRAKAGRKRNIRRSVRNDLWNENFEVDLHREAYLADVVRDRRGADKLNHFMRWCSAITEGMSTQEALDHVRAILPDSVIGDHAYGHWETFRKYRDKPRPWLVGWISPARREQSFLDSTTFRLRRALAVDPTLHARLNAEIKSRKVPEEPRRLLAGVHDVEAFVQAITDCAFALERRLTLELIEQIERQKGGRKAAFLLLLPQQRVDRRVVVGQHRIAA